MGVITNGVSFKRFNHDDVLNRDLVIKMLRREEELVKSDYGQNMYRNSYNNPFISLEVEKAFNRMILAEFGFDTSDDSVDMYRMIFKTYFKSPYDYDREVIESVHYMRENKCVFYTSPPMEIGQKIPNVKLFRVDGISDLTLYDAIGYPRPPNTLFAAFSLS